MFLPTGDTPNPRNFTPWVNYLLIAANVAVYVLISWPMGSRGVDPADPHLKDFLLALMARLPEGVSPAQVLPHISAYDLYVSVHGFKPAAMEAGDLFYSMFLHGGFWHLAGNMLFLWIYGDNVEYRLGRWLYLIAYLVTGVAATLFFALFSLSSMTPLVGASGAISGVLGLYFIFFPRNRIKMLVFFPPLLLGRFLLPSRLVLAFYLVIDNIFPFLFSSGGSVAYGAHIGGFLAGLAAASIAESGGVSPVAGLKRSLRKSFRSKPSASVETVEIRTPLEGLRWALAKGSLETAFECLPALSKSDLRTLTAGEYLRLCEWLLKAEQLGPLSRLARTGISLHPQESVCARLYYILGLTRFRQGQATAAYQHFLNALECNPDVQTEADVRKLLAQIDGAR